ncbi:MAG: dihydrolipoyl dehydrogenase, partial [Verrucomicrobia bacterium]|nr:dihydrolipoyl dehydrogenase [Verrucomicrobiota bacterium]
PSKALLHSTEMFHFAAHGAKAHGIQIKDPAIDISQLMAKKSATVDQLRGGIQHLMKANKIKVYEGLGSLIGGNQIRVLGKSETTLEADHIILATGSSVIELPFLPFDGETVVSSDEAIAFTEVPEKLAVVGAGAIGLELGSVWARLGAQVEVIEFLPNIAAGFDKDVSKTAERLFKKQGLNFHLGTKVTGLKKDGSRAILTAEKDGKNLEFEADKILVAVGRQPNTKGLGLESVGIDRDEKGRIPIDAHYRTSAPGIYAIGDVTTGPMLAHKAEEEAVACVECIAGQAGHVNYDCIPNVIYTEPEIASVGLTEIAAKEKGLNIKVGKFNFLANGRAIATDATDGFAKVIADAESDRLLGIQIIAKSASEMIASAIAHMEYGGSAEDLARTVHAHPTLSETLKEAALAVDGRALHS